MILQVSVGAESNQARIAAELLGTSSEFEVTFGGALSLASLATVNAGQNLGFKPAQSHNHKPHSKLPKCTNW